MNRIIKTVVFSLLSIGLLVSCSEKKEKEIKVINNVKEVRKDALVAVSLDQLDCCDPAKITVFSGSEEIPSQVVDVNHDGTFEYLFFNSDFDEYETKVINVKETDSKKDYPQRAHAEISEKTDYNLVDGVYRDGEYKSVKRSKTPDGHIDHNRFYKYEGPGWESELVGYRLYLDWRNSTDIFGKTKPQVILQDVGHSTTKNGGDSYHELSDWGMDVFKTGNSLGIGTYAAYKDGKLYKVSETDSVVCEITEDGPVYANVHIDHYGWNVEGESADLFSDISICAGQRLTKQYLKLEGTGFTMATGLAKHENTTYFRSAYSEGWNYIALWGTQSLNNDDLGIALFYKAGDAEEITEDDLSYIVVFKNNTNNEYNYYYSASWSMEKEGIASLEEYKEYCENEIVNLNNPIEVNY